MISLSTRRSGANGVNVDLFSGLHGDAGDRQRLLSDWRGLSCDSDGISVIL